MRVYLTNVEGVCRRFCEDKRARLMWVKEEADKFREFWLRLSNDQQRKLLQDKADVILKVHWGRVLELVAMLGSDPTEDQGIQWLPAFESKVAVALV